MLIKLISTIQKLKSYTFSLISVKALSCLLLTIVLNFSLLVPSAKANEMDKIMKMKGYSKPSHFTVIEKRDKHHYNNYNPLHIEDKSDDMVMTEIDMDKHLHYAFIGDSLHEYSSNDCRTIGLGIMDASGNVVVDSGGSSAFPFFEFSPEESGEYVLVSGTQNHNDDKSCNYDIREYIAPNYDR